MTTFIHNISTKLYLTLIFQDRWRFLLDGLIMTMILTSLSFLLGSIIGALLCVVKCSKYKKLSKLLDKIMQVFIGLPTLVILMLFVYFIFKDVSLSVEIIAIIALALKSSSYICSIFYTAVTSVAAGEIEASRALGLSKFHTFLYIILPQAVQYGRDVYKNQFVISLQETAIVGYIAIQDLTRASDVIAYRTLDSITPLLIVSVLYLIISGLFSFGLSMIGRKKHLSEADVSMEVKSI